MTLTTFREQRDEIISEFNYHAVLDHKEALNPSDKTTVADLRRTLASLLDDMVDAQEQGRNTVSIATGAFKVSVSYDMDGENPSLKAVYAPELAGHLADTKKETP